ncbi:MAG: FecR domain-containing protein [Alphaproteobacteria bacterium]
MIRRFLALISLCLVMAVTPAFAGERVGVVDEVEGKVTATQSGSKASRALHDGDAVMEDDLIETAKDSRVKIVFVDKTEFVLAGKGSMHVDDFDFSPRDGKQDKAKLSVLGAAFSWVSGKIGKDKEADVTVNVDFGSIGIRGTEVWRSMHKGECWIYLKSGKIDVSNAGGRVKLKPGEGTIMRAKGTKPDDPHVWSRREINWIKGSVESPRSWKKKGWE